MQSLISSGRSESYGTKRLDVKRVIIALDELISSRHLISNFPLVTWKSLKKSIYIYFKQNYFHSIKLVSNYH